MKVIFLDNDGVICLSSNWGGRSKKIQKYYKANPEWNKMYSTAPVDIRFDNFDKKAIKVLNSILEETGAEIVVSSDWKKHANLEELGDYYESQGIIKRPIAFTPSFIGCEKPEGFEWVRSLQYEQERSLEIAQFVKDHPEITHWVAVDDLNMAVEVLDYSVPCTRVWGVTNFVLTPKSNEGIKQQGIKEKILKFLQ
jgi:hypothetical protein